MRLQITRRVDAGLAARCLPALLIGAFLGLSVPAVDAQESPSGLELVERLMVAFNEHDPDAMVALVTPDIELFYVDGSESVRGSAGREDLRRSMEGYFGEFPDVASTLNGSISGGRFVSFREEVSWTSNGVRRSQASMAVAEIEGGLIRRIWYFAAES